MQKAILLRSPNMTWGAAKSQLVAGILQLPNVVTVITLSGPDPVKAIIMLDGTPPELDKTVASIRTMEDALGTSTYEVEGTYFPS